MPLSLTVHVYRSRKVEPSGWVSDGTVGVGPFVLETGTKAGEPWLAAFEPFLWYPTVAGLKGNVGTVEPEAQRTEHGVWLPRPLQQLLEKEGLKEQETFWFLDKGRG